MEENDINDKSAQTSGVGDNPVFVPPRPLKRRRQESQTSSQNSAMLASAVDVLKSSAMQLNSGNPEVKSFCAYLGSKMMSYSNTTRLNIQHAVYNLLMEADMEVLEQQRQQTPIQQLFRMQPPIIQTPFLRASFSESRNVPSPRASFSRHTNVPSPIGSPSEIQNLTYSTDSPSIAPTGTTYASFLPTDTTYASPSPASSHTSPSPTASIYTSHSSPSSQISEYFNATLF